jgi:5-amino-6-(5-phosphoribosylamino)uracil reductase
MALDAGAPRFDLLFDDAEPGPGPDPALAPYGSFGFPSPPAGRPWVYTNFVQSLDGIVSLLGEYASGQYISQSKADRWLMDALRTHADGLIMGMATLLEERRLRGRESRGIVFQVVDPEMQGLRTRLGKRRERNIFITRAADLDLSQFKVFDGDLVDSAIVTSPAGAERLRAKQPHPHVAVVAAGVGEELDLPGAIAKLREQLGIEYLLCEGGPTLYGSLARADLIDEKFLTVSPIEVGQLVPPEQKRLPQEEGLPVLLRPTIFAGPGFTKDTLSHWQWMSCRKSGDHQFHRYRRKRAS